MSDTLLGWCIVAVVFVAMITAIVVMNRLRERDRRRQWESGKHAKGMSAGGAAAAGGLAAGNCGAGCGGGGGCGGRGMWGWMRGRLSPPTLLCCRMNVEGAVTSR